MPRFYISKRDGCDVGIFVTNIECSLLPATGTTEKENRKSSAIGNISADNRLLSRQRIRGAFSSTSDANPCNTLIPWTRSSRAQTWSGSLWLRAKNFTKSSILSRRLSGSSADGSLERKALLFDLRTVYRVLVYVWQGYNDVPGIGYDVVLYRQFTVKMWSYSISHHWP